VAEARPVKVETEKDIESPNGTPKKKWLMKKKDLQSPTPVKTESVEVGEKKGSSIRMEETPLLAEGQKAMKDLEIKNMELQLKGASVKNSNKKAGAPIKKICTSSDTEDHPEDDLEMADADDDESSEYGDDGKKKSKSKKKAKKGSGRLVADEERYRELDKQLMEKYQAILCTGKEEHLGYNLKYGQRLQVMWAGYWYKARAVWYSYQDDGDLLLKVNFDGWPKSEDHYINVVQEAKECIRGPDFDVEPVTLGRSKPATFNVNGIKSSEHYGLKTREQIEFVKKHGYYLSALPEHARFLPK
jgi:hypothetical protein